MRVALARQDQLTKPRGALGRLEEVAVRLAAMQRRDRPSVDEVHIVVFAADHGVASEGVSAYPQSVTVEMLRNFSRGGAAISVLAQELGATLEVVDVGLFRKQLRSTVFDFDEGFVEVVVTEDCVGAEGFRHRDLRGLLHQGMRKFAISNKSLNLAMQSEQRSRSKAGGDRMGVYAAGPSPPRPVNFAPSAPPAMLRSVMNMKYMTSISATAGALWKIRAAS
jgi:hypothetical protein